MNSVRLGVSRQDPPLTKVFQVSSRGLKAFIVFVAVVTGIGCEPEAQITTRTVERTEPPRPIFDVEKRKAKMAHTLVAILGADDKAWFFKVSGPARQVEPRRDEFVAFLETLGPAAKKGDPPSWKLPEGWLEQPGSQLRAATIKMSAEADATEIAVSSLPLTDDWDRFVARNVERWMGQLDQGPLSDETIQKLAEVVETPAGNATVLHLAGLARREPMANPHAQQTTEPAHSNDRVATKSPAAEGKLKYDTPTGWEAGRLSPMRKAAFEISQDEMQALVTVITLPAAGGPQVSDVTANVLRWAGQVGLTDLNAESIGKLIEGRQIDGVEASYVALLGAESEEKPRGMLAAMCVRDGTVWFFKLSGDRPLVEDQREEFGAFLDSFRFE